MAQYPLRMNGVQPSTYNANLVDFTVGACSYDNGYMLPKSSMRPYALKPTYGTRDITITLDVSGKDYHDISLQISRITANLQQEDCLLQLPDGFYYHCAYEKASTPKEKAPWIWQVKYTLVGWKTAAMQTVSMTGTKVIRVDGNVKTPVILTITPATSGGTVEIEGLTFFKGTGSITVNNVTGKITIDSIRKTVMDEAGNNLFADTDISEFPNLSPGKNIITATGASEVLVRFWPAFV